MEKREISKRAGGHRYTGAQIKRVCRLANISESVAMARGGRPTDDPLDVLSAEDIKQLRNQNREAESVWCPQNL